VGVSSLGAQKITA